MSIWWKVGAFSGMSAVLLGAFGSHALRSKAWMTPRDLQVWETACQYQFYHSLATLLAVTRGNALSAKLFAAGIFLFSGSLYLMTLSGEKRLGIITPVGGLSFAAGWFVLAITP